MKSIKFDMVWKMHGSQELYLPDDIDINDKKALIAYILSNWDNVVVPEGILLEGSNVLDKDGEITVYNEQGSVLALHKN